MDKLAAKGGTPVRTTAFPGWPQYDEAEHSAVLRVLDSRNWWATEGVEVRAFETEWAAFTGAGGAVAVTNGTHALEVALTALDIGQGDEVIVPDWSFMATIGAVLAVNAIPVIVDVDPQTWTIDVAAAPPRSRPEPGPCCRSISGATWPTSTAYGRWRRHTPGDPRGRGTGSWVQLAGQTRRHTRRCRDFLVPGVEEHDRRRRRGGGCQELRGACQRLESLANCGRRPGTWFYRHFELAGNLRMTEWQGAVLRAQLKRFPAQQAVRSANVDFLNAALADLPGITPQGRYSGCTSQGNYDYLVKFDPELFPDRDRVRTALIAEGMPLTTGYPPMHQLEMFGQGEGGLGPRLGTRAGYPAYPRHQHFPVSEDLAKTTIWFKTAALAGSPADPRAFSTRLRKVHSCAADLADLEPTEY